MWIKICGMTTPDAVEAALEAQVDAIGFVFAPASVRHLTPQRARELAAPARGRTLCVAVTQHPEAGLLDEILATFAPDLLQTDAVDAEALARVPPRQRLPVLRAGQPPAQPLPERIVFEGPRSGTGTTTDWAQAAALAARTQLVLAGGLAAANVAEAIRSTRPFGVDVSSGVEQRPGIKSRALILQFVEATRTAAATSEAKKMQQS